jgi:peptidoglycan/xylan/chitin deacetylase (PgdA/CDA1 family)
VHIWRNDVRVNWRATIAVACALAALTGDSAAAAGCPGNPGALGTSRVITLDPRAYPRIGTIQYAGSLPLADRDVVLTFDDGPMPPYSDRVLDILASQCVKATYFLIGRMARGYPGVVRRIEAAGHTIGTHSQNHPLAFERMALPAVQREIEQGIASATAALGTRRAVAPFFRIPGLLRARHVENYLQAKGLATWSADVVADDWKHISAAEVVRRAVTRLDEKGKGVLLLHDIQPATALGLPELLRQLKARGYRIVHVVPGRGASPAPVAAAPAPAPDAAVVLAQAGAPAAAATTPKPETGEPPADNRTTLQPAVSVTPVADDNQAQPADAAAEASPPAPSQHDAATPRDDATAAEASAPAAVAVESVVAEPPTRVPVVPGEAILPFTPGIKPTENVASPAKLLAAEPGGWPPARSVPLPSAGGVGVSALPRNQHTPDGRFQSAR